MSEQVRRDEYIGRTSPQETVTRAPRPAPVWAYLVLGILLVVGAVMVLSINHPFLWGFIASMVVAAVAERALDRIMPAWAEGYVVADLEPAGRPARLWFRAQRGAAPLALLFLAAVLSAGFFFVGTLLAPVELTRWFSAFGLLILVGVGYGAVLLGRGLRRVEIRLDATGVTAVGLFGRETTVPWAALAGAFAAGDELLLTTTNGSVRWPGRQLTSDPEIVAEIIDRCAGQSRPDAVAALAVIDELVAQRRPRR